MVIKISISYKNDFSVLSITLLCVYDAISKQKVIIEPRAWVGQAKTTTPFSLYLRTNAVKTIVGVGEVSPPSINGKY